MHVSKDLLRKGLLLALSIPLFVALDSSSIWDSNEAFYVQAPREMLARSDWVIPYFNGQPRLNKPPLSYWLVASFYSLFGVSVLGERLLAALCGVASIVAVFHLGKRLFSPHVGMLAAGIFATTFRFLVLARRALLEVLLLALILWALVFWLRWLQRSRAIDLAVSSALLGLAFLTKGPLVLLVPFICFLFLLLARDCPPTRPAFLVAAILPFLVVATPWFLVVGLSHGWEPVWTFFARENLGRYVSLDYGPQRGLLYYPGVFLADFFPWSLFFFASLFWWWQRRDRKEEDSQSNSLFFILLWVVLWIGVFTLSHNKQEYYILPVYPLASLWVARYLEAPRCDRVPVVASSLALPLAAILLTTLANLLFGFSWRWTIWWLPALAFSLFSIRRLWVPALLSLSLCYATALQFLSGPLEEFRPVRPLARLIRSLEKDSGRPFQAGYFRLSSPSLSFYLDQPILELFDPSIAAAALGSDQRTYLVLRKEDLDLLRQAGSPEPIILASLPRLATSLPVIFEALRSDGAITQKENFLPRVLLVANKTAP